MGPPGGKQHVLAARYALAGVKRREIHSRGHQLRLHPQLLQAITNPRRDRQVAKLGLVGGGDDGLGEAADRPIRALS